MKINSTIQLMGGGPGSGCKGPNCGRKSTKGPATKSSKGSDFENVLRNIDRRGAGIVGPDNEVHLSPQRDTMFEHERMAKEFYAPDKSKPVLQTPRKGIVSFTYDPKRSMVYFSSPDDKSTVERALKVINALPTLKIDFEYVGYREDGDKSINISKPPEEVTQKIKAWYSKWHNGDSV